MIEFETIEHSEMSFIDDTISVHSDGGKTADVHEFVEKCRHALLIRISTKCK